jgi:hypothetical protein
MGGIDQGSRRKGEAQGRSAVPSHSSPGVHSYTEKGRSTQAGLPGDYGGVLGSQNRIWRFEMEEGFSVEDLLVELGRLEHKVPGNKGHGPKY